MDTFIIGIQHANILSSSLKICTSPNGKELEQCNRKRKLFRENAPNNFAPYHQDTHTNDERAPKLAKGALLPMTDLCTSLLREGLFGNKRHKRNQSNSLATSIERWRANKSFTEDCFRLVDKIITPPMPNSTITCYNPQSVEFPNDLFSPFSKAPQLSSLNQTTFSPIEKWSPFEVVMFESSLQVNGKNFHAAQKVIGT